MPVYNSALNILQLALHPNFVWTVASVISLLFFLLIPVIYIYVLDGYIHYKNHVNFIIYPAFATALGLLAQIFLALIINLQMWDFISEVAFMPLFLCVLSSICRFLTGCLLMIDCVSGEELFTIILNR